MFNCGTIRSKSEEKCNTFINKNSNKDSKTTSHLKLKRQDANRNQKSHKASKFHVSSSSSSSTSSLSILKTSKNLNNLSNDNNNNRTFQCVNSVNDSGIEMNIFKIINKKALSEASLNSNTNNNYVSNIRSSSSSKSISSAVKFNIKKSDSESALRSLLISTSSYNGSFDNINFIEKYSTNDTSNLFYISHIF